jgi:hypothetical protein
MENLNKDVLDTLITEQIEFFTNLKSLNMLPTYTETNILDSIIEFNESTIGKIIKNKPELISENELELIKNSQSEKFNLGKEVVTFTYSNEKEVENDTPQQTFIESDVKLNTRQFNKATYLFNEYKERLNKVLNEKCDGSPHILMTYLEENPTAKDYIDGKISSY